MIQKDVFGITSRYVVYMLEVVIPLSSHRHIVTHDVYYYSLCTKFVNFLEVIQS